MQKRQFGGPFKGTRPYIQGPKSPPKFGPSADPKLPSPNRPLPKEALRGWIPACRPPVELSPELFETKAAPGCFRPHCGFFEHPGRACGRVSVFGGWRPTLSSPEGAGSWASPLRPRDRPSVRQEPLQWKRPCCACCPEQLHVTSPYDPAP